MSLDWKRPKDRYPHTADERFEIAPIYRSTVRPSGYFLRDKKTGKRHSCDTVREAKARAEEIVRDGR